MPVVSGLGCCLSMRLDQALLAPHAQRPCAARVQVGAAEGRPAAGAAAR